MNLIGFWPIGIRLVDKWPTLGAAPVQLLQTSLSEFGIMLTEKRSPAGLQLRILHIGIRSQSHKAQNHKALSSVPSSYVFDENGT